MISVNEDCENIDRGFRLLSLEKSMNQASLRFLGDGA